MSSVTSKNRDSNKTTERLPAIEESLSKQKSRIKKSSSGKTSISNINLPKLKSRENSAVRQSQLGSDSQEDRETLFNSLKCIENAQKVQEETNFKSGSNAVGPSECQLLFEVPSSELNEVSEIEEEKLEESRAIKRWEYWMKDKVRLQNHFSKCLERSPCDLLIQKPDKIRQLMEEKTLLEYSQIPEADKWRGHPYQWKPPLCLGNKESCDLENSPKYCGVKLKSEKNEISEMEFIGIPKTVQKEKGVMYKSGKSSMNIWERMSYRQERINYFMSQRKKLKPHEIQMDNLEVVGTKIYPAQEETKKALSFVDLPKIIITADENESLNCLDHRQSVFCLVIDGEEIKYQFGTDDCQNPSKVFTWQINFGVVGVRTLNEKVLRVENRGTMAVSYDWLSRNIEQKQSLDILQPSQHEPWFFFDKNSGQIYDLKFYFYTKRSGVRKEVWYLRAKPPFSRSQEISKIVLSAVATEEPSGSRNDLESYLRKRVRDSVVAFAIKILLYKVFNVSKSMRGIEYRSIFCEKDLFEYHNSKYYYHSIHVKTLKELFEEIPSKSQSEWDLSLDTLIEIIKTSNEKKKTALLQISGKAKKLLRPNYLSVKTVKKYRMTYEILCKMTNFMEEDYSYIRNLVSEKLHQYGEKLWSEEETDDLTSSFSLKSEETGESSRTLFEIKPRNCIFFQIMFYIKVYNRVCEAVEEIVGILETRKLFQTRRQYDDYKLEKPTQRNMKKCTTKAPLE